MGQRRLPWTEEYIAQCVREGRGQGDGHDFQPWITVQSFSSTGNQSRIPNAELGSSVHVMSNLERALFLLFRHRRDLRAYRSQFPLAREVTLSAAKAMAIRHPFYPQTSVPLVMTIDALVTTVGPDGQILVAAWDVKPKSKLRKRRTLEKLSLHRAACAYLGYSHHIFTEDSVSRTTIQTIEWIAAARVRFKEHPEELAAVEAHKLTVVGDLFHKRPRKSLDNYCVDSDAKHGVEWGTTLRAIKQLILDGAMSVDVRKSRQEILALRIPVPFSPFLPQPGTGAP